MNSPHHNCHLPRHLPCHHSISELRRTSIRNLGNKSGDVMSVVTAPYSSISFPDCSKRDNRNILPRRMNPFFTMHWTDCVRRVRNPCTIEVPMPINPVKQRPLPSLIEGYTLFSKAEAFLNIPSLFIQSLSLSYEDMIRTHRRKIVVSRRSRNQSSGLCSYVSKTAV